MSIFTPLPLGQRIPDSVHGVSCSLPTMRDVIGYEERKPEVLCHLASGYPRFVVHPFIRQLSERFREELGLEGHTVWLTTSGRMADELAVELGEAHVLRTSHDGLPIVAHLESPEIYGRAKLFLQNTGGFISSREAEDHLVRRGLLPGPHREATAGADALALVTTKLVSLFPGITAPDVIITPGGMNAFSAGWKSLADLQRARGRTIWIQLGWLYLDTMAVLKRWVLPPEHLVHLADVMDTAAVVSACEHAGDRLAGLVTETPTNPLIQTADLQAIASAVWRHGGRMLVDPTLASPLNVDVLSHTDLVVNSLTKYAASEGDVLAGAVIVNPARADADFLRVHAARRADSIYRRDLARLAVQLQDYEALVTQTNETAREVVRYLARHPCVEEVYWPLRGGSRNNYLKLARSEAHVGAMISFTVKGPMSEFYDKVQLPKGPSFGMKTTLLCPFMYLAHYDLVTTPSGRAILAASGIDPSLLRLSVGMEPAEAIISALADALGH